MLRPMSIVLALCFLFIVPRPAAGVAPLPTGLVPDALRATRVTGGLAVHIGVRDNTVLAPLVHSGFLVHGLTFQPNVGPLRQAFLNDHLGGLAVIDRWYGGRLPYPDRFVNLLIVDLDDLAITQPGLRQSLPDEIRRVLLPGGAAYVRIDRVWRILTAAPGSIDDWSHKWYDATGNPVSRDRIAGPPTAIQWAQGPAFADGAVGGKMARIGGGAFVCVDSVDGALFARHAGNGLPLWRADLRLSTTTDFVLSAGRVFLHTPMGVLPQRRNRETGPFVALDLATGRQIQTYEKAIGITEAPAKSGPEFSQFLVLEDGILQSVGAELAHLDRKSGERRWIQTLSDGVWFAPIVLDGKVVVAECDKPEGRRRLDNNVSARAIVAFDLPSGKRLWRNPHVLPPWGKVERKDKVELHRPSLSPLVGGQGHVILHAGSYQSRAPGAFLAALSLEDGKERWRHSFTEKDWTNTVESSRTLIRDGVVYYLGGKGAITFDLRTGKANSDFQKRPRYAFNGYGECSGSRGTVNWLIGNALCYYDKDMKLTETWAARSACGTGVIPAQGMIFALPTGCDCADYSRGYLGLACSALPARIADKDRLQPGPAFGKTEAMQDHAEDWPVFLANPQRTARVSHALPAKLQEKWRSHVVVLPQSDLLPDRRRSEYHLGTLSAPVAAQGTVVVGCGESHAVAAFDSGTGKRRWLRPLGGKVSAPPTIHGRMALVGCQDGFVSALRLSDGELVWRFQAAPVEQKAVLHGHLASAFPVLGGLPVVGGRLLVTAGHHSYLGGIQVYALEPTTGKILGRSEIQGGDSAPRPVLNDILSATADSKLFWLGETAAVTLDGKSQPVMPKKGPKVLDNPPVVAFQRTSTLVRFPHDLRGGSTHGWVRPAATGGARGLRVVRDGEMAYALNDPREMDRHPVHAGKRPVVTAYSGTFRDRKVVWEASVQTLGSKESYGAMIQAGDRLYIGGGKRDGSSGVVQVLAAKDGRLLAEHVLPGRVTECGLAIARGRLFVSCEDGTLVCLGE